MGNSAGKEFKATELSDGSLLKDESMSIHGAFVSKERLTIKAKGKKWVEVETKEIIWTSKAVGMIKSHVLIKDPDDNEVVTIITEKMGMASVIDFVCKDTPTFDGQDPLTAKELKKAGIEEGKILYKYSKIDTKRELTKGKCSYSIVTGMEGDDLAFTELYTGEKLSSMGFMAVFKEGEICVAKASTPGMTMNPQLESAVGVDLLAVVLMGYTLAGGDGAAGALAGAGAI